MPNLSHLSYCIAKERPLRIWLRPADYMNLHMVLSRNYVLNVAVMRYCGVPISIMTYDAPSRIVLADGSTVLWNEI